MILNKSMMPQRSGLTIKLAPKAAHSLSSLRSISLVSIATA